MLRIQKILVPTDFSPVSELGLDFALSVSKTEKMELHLVHVLSLYVENPHSPNESGNEMDTIISRLLSKAEEKMKALIDGKDTSDVTVVQRRIQGVSVGQEILDYVKTHGIDLVVMGTRGRRGLSRMILGSVAEEVIHQASCPVITMRSDKQIKDIHSLQKILVPVDFSKNSKDMFSFAVQFAKLNGSRLDLLHVIEESVLPSIYRSERSRDKREPDIENRSTLELKKWKNEAETEGISTCIHLVHGNPAKEIVKAASEENSDLVMISTQGLTGFEHLILGSVTEKVVRLAGCPVFTV